MNFVDSLNLFGVEAKEIPCLRGSGAPDSRETAGAVGSLYIDTDTGELYKCIEVRKVAEDAYEYEWVIVNGGSEGATSIVTFDLAALGLSNLNVATGEAVTLETDTTEIAAAMESGFVQFVVNFDYRGLSFTNVKVTVPPNCGYGVTGFNLNTVFFFIVVGDGKITAYAKMYPAAHGLPDVTTDDSGKFLRVVDGAWAAVAVNSAEEASF